MSLSNRVSVVYTEEKITEIKSKIEDLKNDMMTNLINLTVEERQSLHKMGDKTYSFVLKSKELMTENPEFRPQYVDLDEMEIDLNTVKILSSYLITIEQLRSALDDTIMLAGSEALATAMAFYQFLKGASKSNVKNTKVLFDELKPQFKKNK